MLEKYLQEIGLTDKEASVYLALLAADNSSVVELAGKTKIKRPTVYVVLETLAKKGLVSETTIGKKVHYQAEQPERLETFVERQQIVLAERAKRLKDIIPEIKTVQRESGERPVVKYFEGRNGIVSANEDLYRTAPDGSPIYLIYPKDLLGEIFTEQEKEVFRKVRLSKNIKAKVICTSSSEVVSDSMSERVKIDHQKYPLTCDISIHQDKVRISILGGELSGIFIQSRDFANTMRSLFNLAFDQIKNPRS